MHGLRLFAASVAVFALGAVSHSVPTASGAVVPGALDGHAWVYADNWHGWPVSPVWHQHPVRGSFLDPRGETYHFGIDISVNDKDPELGHPRNATHRVFAVEGGYVTQVHAAPCPDGRIRVGHFEYWHVTAATVHVGSWVAPGHVIAWTCLASWHVHLSEWTMVHGTLVWVNPLHAGGKLTPYHDTLSPVVHEVRFRTTTGGPLKRDNLHGLVDARAWISDPQSYRGFWTGDYALLYADLHPYSVTVRLLRAGRLVYKRKVFQADALLSTRLSAIGTPVPFWNHYAPGTRKNWNANLCLARRPPSCQGTYWFRLFGGMTTRYWNTAAFPNGNYVLTVSARDPRRNFVLQNVPVTIRN